MIFRITTVLFTLLLGISCHEIPVNIGEIIIPDTGKKVLIEDLTGASCPNCPKGAAVIKNILQKYPDQVVAIGIHGFFLSNPTPKSKYDFRNPAARDLEKWFNPTGGKPAASVNRVKITGSSLLSYLPDLWQSLIEAELQKAQEIELNMQVNYDKTSRKLQLDLTVIPLTDLSGEFSVSIYLTESEIVDAQSNGGEIIENYVHDHVLHAMLTKFDGDAFGSDLKKGKSVTKIYSYTLPESVNGLWNDENIHISAMIARNSSDSKEVIQAVEKKLF